MRNPVTVAAVVTVLAGVGLLVPASTVAGQRGFARPGGARDVTVPGIAGVVEAGGVWVRAWQGADNADGLVGTDDGSLLFAQEQPNRVSRLDAADRLSVAIENTHGVGALAIDRRGRVLAALRTCTDPGGKPEQCTEPTSIAVLSPTRTTLASSFERRPLGRLNDLVVHASGGVFFTVGGAFFANTAGVVSSLGENIRANGIMLSPDEKTLYVTNGAEILAFDVAADGAASNRRSFGTLQAGGSGDGLAVDAAGRLYVTSQPGVQVFEAGGRYLGLIPTPRNAISAAFAGPGKRTLYVVGSGGVGADGQELVTPPGVRNNAKTIYKLTMLAAGFAGRAK